MTESIGTARLDIVVDTTNMQAGVDAAVRKTKELDGASTQASKSSEQNSARQVAALKRQIDTLGLSRDAMIRYRVETQTTGKAQAELLAKLDAQSAKLAMGAKQMGAYGMSAKQTQFALRGVPAQLTDIFTSIQGGQRPLTVLIQQFGQLKDMFGGIVPAARALAGSVLNLVNPYTLAAGAVGLLAFAWVKAADQAAEFNKALVSTGLNASLTTADLEKMADQIGRATSASSGHAADVLAQVTASGRFTADQINLVAEAATRMESATGKAIQDTINEFVRLQDDPVSAILKLNEAQHFLTEETLKQITSLKDQGNEAGAAAVAIRAYADTINTRAPEIESHLSAWTFLWHDVKDAAGDAFGALVSGFRDTSGAAQSAIASTVSLNSALSGTGALASAAFATIFKLRAAQAAAAEGRPDFSGVQDNGGSRLGRGGGIIDSRAAKAKIDAEKEFGTIREGHLSNAKKLEAEIAHIREVGKKAGVKQAEIEEQVAAARAKGAISGGSSGGGRSRSAVGGRSAAPRALPDFSAKAADDAAHLAEQEARATEAFKDMAATLAGPLAQAQREHEKTVQRLNELAQQSPAAAAGLTEALRQEADQYAKTTAEIQKQLDPIGQVLAAQALELEMIGKSNAEREVMNALLAKGIDLRSADAQAALAQARANQSEAESRQQSIDLMDRFRQGASDALTDFVTGAKSAKDALRDFFDEMAAQITKAIADQWIKQLFGSQGSDGSGTSGGGWLNAIMGLFGGGGGEQWYANGGAFAGGVQKFATGGVFDKPTMFGMAGGRMGVMGEAGPEAVMPLHRGPDGKLGVRAAANDDGRRIGPAVVNQTLVLQGRPDSRTPSQYAQAAATGQNRVLSRNS